MQLTSTPLRRTTLLLACIAAVAQRAQAHCVMPLEISNRSSIIFTGTSVEPLIAPIELYDAPALSFDGSFSLWLAGACPQTREQLRIALTDAELRAKELALLPSKLVAEASHRLDLEKPLQILIAAPRPTVTGCVKFLYDVYDSARLCSSARRLGRAWQRCASLAQR